MENKITLADTLRYVSEARERGLAVPVVVMGYLNPFLAYGLDRLMTDARASGESARDRVIWGLFVVGDTLQHIHGQLSVKLIAWCRFRQGSHGPHRTDTRYVERN